MDNNKTGENIGQTHIMITFPHALAKRLCSITELTFHSSWVHNLLFPMNFLIFTTNMNFWVIFNLDAQDFKTNKLKQKQNILWCSFWLSKVQFLDYANYLHHNNTQWGEMKENWIGWSKSRKMLCRLESNKAYKNTNICSVIAISDSEFNSTDNKFKVHKITQNKCTTDAK